MTSENGASKPKVNLPNKEFIECVGKCLKTKPYSSLDESIYFNISQALGSYVGKWMVEVWGIRRQSVSDNHMKIEANKEEIGHSL